MAKFLFSPGLRVSGTLKNSGSSPIKPGLNLDYGTVTPRDDANAGSDTGRRMHNPITISKDIDNTSPELMHAYATKLTLDLVVIELGEPRPKGLPAGSILTLHGATVIGIQKSNPPVRNSKFSGTSQTEEIKFALQTIDVTWTDGGKTHKANWLTR
jgi:type VI secretion system secreted protein Hcp